MNGIYNVIWSKVKQRFVVVSELVHSCTKHSGRRATRKMATVLAVLALTASAGSLAEAATNGEWTTGVDGNGNFTAHIDTANTMGASAKTNTVLGDGNTVNTSSNDITGDNNTLGSGTGSDYVIGDSNEIKNLRSSWVIGNANKIYTNDKYYGASNSLILGSNNTSTEEINSTIFIGNKNKVTDYIKDSVAIGSGMEFGKRSDNSVVIGNNAKNGVFPELASSKSNLVGSNGSVVIGDSASNQSPYSVVIGANAKMGDKWSSAGVSVVIGANATIADDSADNILIGSSNSKYTYSKIGTNVDWAIAMGHQVEIGDTSDQSVVIGGTSARIGNNAAHGTVLGSFSTISDDTWFGTALGYSAEVTGRSSLAIGHDAHIGVAGEPESRYSLAIGYKAKLESGVENATAVGPESNIKSGAKGSVAVGIKSTIEKGSFGSVAIGSNSNVKGTNNIAIGSGAKTTTKPGNVSSSVALGNSAKVEVGYSIGLGSSAAISEVAERSSVVGYGVATKSKYSSILGASSKIGSNSDYSFIGGYKSSIGDNVDRATLIGSSASVNSIGGTAIGFATAVDADTNYSVALGRSSKVKADNIFTTTKLTEFKADLGSYYDKNWNISSADGSYGVLSVGDSSGKRRIINVSKGRISADSYDAINGSQIYHLTNALNAQIAAAGGSVAAGTNVASVATGEVDGKKVYTVNAKNASVSVGDNFTLTTKENTTTNITDYNIKLKDIVTIGGVTEGNNPIKIDGTVGDITGLTNKTLDSDDFATVGRAATEEQLKLVMSDITDIKGSSYQGWNITVNDADKTAVGSDSTVDFSGTKDGDGNQNIIISKEENKLSFGLNDKITLGTGNTQVVVNGKEGSVNIGSEAGKKIDFNGTTGIGQVGNIIVNGDSGEITGLTNTTLDSEDFATVGRAATEEQLKGVNQQVTNNSAAINHLGGRVNQLSNRIDKAGAGAAALAALHPLDFDPDDKWDFVAGYGNYRGENAMALGAFYRTNEDTMFSVGGTLGNGDNMFNAGISLKFGQGNNISTTRVAMAKEIKDMCREMEAMKSAMLDSHAGRKIDTSKLQLFPDVPQNHWAYEYVATLAGNGMIQGYPDGTYDGNRPMTRYEFAAMLYRAMLNGATLSDKILTEFAPELERFTVDTVHTDKDGNPTVERVRVARQK
ncbi:S-layer homology domain-containing protein [uncultured Veillonella sp.]|uniref:S-layer homology domain-containing protein n=1 Tax=uncultured Veillonella sp. TaxID=159268 RepID=UPI0025EF635C|nr:S-layer homology domain-containing protein [uncultured Veillonella sp.]